MPRSPAPIPYHLAIIIADLEEMIDAADRAKLGTLGYLLSCALIEAQRQAEEYREASRPNDGSEPWRPVP
jgi:hypothetical protein